jgi:hypothetical protein
VGAANTTRQRVVFTLFWTTETDPDAKRQFLSLIFENVWLEQDRVVAVQPKPYSFPTSCAKSRGKYGSDGGRTRSGQRIEIRV